MQIFLLDLEPEVNASYYMDKHVVKIPADIQQILLNACARMRIKFPRIYAYNSGMPLMPLPSIMNHPFVKWASRSPANFDYILELGLNLVREYRLRFGEAHYCSENLYHFNPLSGNDNKPEEMEHFPWMLPMAYQIREAGLVASYQTYYIEVKNHLAVWSKPRSRPEWFPERAVIEGKKISKAFHAARRGNLVDGIPINLSTLEEEQ